MSNNKSKGLDYKKLNLLTPKINQRAILDSLDSAPDSFISFTTGEISTYCLNQIKSSLKVNLSPKVLSNWVKANVTDIDKTDRGKIKRFSRLENIWLRIALDLRTFGVPLKSLSYIREQMFSYEVDGFNIIKFKILNSILGNLEYLIIDSEMKIGFYSYKRYSELSSKGYLLPHISLRLIDYIRDEFENNSFHKKFDFKNIEENTDKVALKYFLRTNDFISIKVKVTPEDIRLIEDSRQLTGENSISQLIFDWKFESLDINLEDDVLININNKIIQK